MFSPTWEFHVPFKKKKGEEKHKRSIQNQKEDSFAMSNLCRGPFCSSLWLFSRGSALEIALQSATTPNNHQCVHEEGFCLKLCEVLFHTFKKVLLQKSVARRWKSPLVHSGTSLWGFFVRLLPFELFAKNEWKTRHNNCQLLRIHSL